MTKDEALRLAIDALKDFDYDKRLAAIKVCEEALAQPEPYPVALISPSKGNSVVIGQDRWRVGTQDWLPLYLHPKEWQDLTLEEKHQLNDSLNLQGRFPIIEAILAAAKEKNT